MNFTSFGGALPGGGGGAGAGGAGAGAVPSIQQFTAKFGYEGANTALHTHDTRTYQSGVQLSGQGTTLVEMNVGKFRGASDGSGAGVVVSIGNAPAPAHHSVAGTIPLAPLNSVTVNTGVKYQTMTASATVGTVGALGAVGTVGALGAMGVESVGYCGQLGYVPELQPLREHAHAHSKRDYREDHIMGTIHHIQQHHVGGVQGLQQQPQQLVVLLTDPKDVCKVKQERDRFHLEDALATTAEFISVDAVPVSTWQQLGGVGAGVADYLSALPLQLHHLLKYSETSSGGGGGGGGGGKRDQPTILATLPVALHQHQQQHATIQANTLSGVVVQTATIINEPIAESPPPITHTASTNTTSVTTSKKKKKKKSQKEKKPRPKPGEIRLTTALDGSTLYCCPECHMAYPERGLLEQHLLGHTMERKFICEICNAALKRKDHLTRHKQSHNPERPYVCSVCLKAFKRKEQLTLHFVIHSGEKRHVCQECGKGFYRKDHLRKHTRSHIARRVKAELAAGGAAGSLPRAVPAPQLPPPLHRV